jgi:hypothetical protein
MFWSVFFVCECSLLLMENVLESRKGWIIINDLQGFKRNHCNIEVAKKLAQLYANLPFKFVQCFLINMPASFKIFWEIAQSFLSLESKKRFKKISMKELDIYFSNHELPKKYGGNGIKKIHYVSNSCNYFFRTNCYPIFLNQIYK